MRQRWDDYDRAAAYGPSALAVKAVCGMFVLAALIGVLGYSFGWFGQAAQVVKDEFGPRQLLAKYSWFKDAAAACDAKLASLRVYEQRFQDLKAAYGETPRTQWSRADKEQWNLWASEVAGIAASYNLLAADYNAQMAKFHWRFANVGDLPVGATIPLPREFRPYHSGGNL